ncbi:Phosphatidylinositol 4-phosphate 5-kinase [Arachis hypogaea]|nr:Phosphatidylinositol 4-phosphate 5-kinase [Arachis hypogaea]
MSPSQTPVRVCSQITPNGDLHNGMLTESVVNGTGKYHRLDGYNFRGEWGGFSWPSEQHAKMSSPLK